MLFCDVVITFCVCTFVTCTLIKINQSDESLYSRNTMNIGYYLVCLYLYVGVLSVQSDFLQDVQLGSPTIPGRLPVSMLHR